MIAALAVLPVGLRLLSVKYLEVQPTGTFSRGKELPYRQPSHDV